jgi:hypothetical protein
MSEQVGQDPGRGPRIEEWLLSKGVSGCPLCRLEGWWKYDEVRDVVVINARDAREIGLESPQHRNPVSEASADINLLRSQQRGIRQTVDDARRYELKCGHCGHVVLLDVKTVEGEAATTLPAEPI